MTTSSASASTEEYIEILNAEQQVDLQKLKDFARHGTQPSVRGEVWLYLLGILSDDKSQEMTSVRGKYQEYEQLDKHNIENEKRIRHEAIRYYKRKLIPRPPPGRTLARSAYRIAMQNGLSHATTNDAIITNLLTNEKQQQQQQQNSTSISINTPFSATLPSSPLLRGPNRMDNGQTRILAGILGDASTEQDQQEKRTLNSSIATDEDEEEDEDDDKKVDQILLDPEAAAANEMKRFCQAVENVICAYLNRWRWKSNDGKITLIGFNNSKLNNQEENPPSESVAQTPRLSATNRNSTNENITLTSIGDSSFTTAPMTINEDQNDILINGKTSSSSSSSAILPLEYEWAHQNIEIPNLITNSIKESDGKFERAIYHSDLILLCSPFVKCIRSEVGIFFAFERLMMLIDEYDLKNPLPLRIANFLTLFRTTLPDLYEYFDEEEVDIISLASNWLRHLLASELRIEDLLRLWDTYFSVQDPIDLHMYVCIAILTHCKDALEELDQSEARTMLFTLPPLDIDRIINDAINIRLSHKQSELPNDEEIEEINKEIQNENTFLPQLQQQINNGKDQKIKI